MKTAKKMATPLLKNRIEELEKRVKAMTTLLQSGKAPHAIGTLRMYQEQLTPLKKEFVRRTHEWIDGQRIRKLTHNPFIGIGKGKGNVKKSL